ncbi:ATP-binding protein [Dendrosporobacter sp. 1207_IL3150]|uniref:ATP-binding protein n=1 Tax=Dendrosporobacter sp. 1207_IL3150 TaxID=3084054 RepID=UPI002FD8F138
MDLPFLINVSWIAPWGFLIDAALRFIIAIGTLIVYLDKTRYDLLAKEQYYRLLAENASDVIYRFKFVPKMHFEYISPSVKKLTGHSPHSFYNSIRLIFSLTTPNDRPILRMFARKFFYEPDHTLILRIRRSDTSMIWVEQTSVPIVNEEGSCIGFEGIVRDITTRKNLEQDISRLDSLNTVGQMAASVAHEIRNPMTTIRGYLQFFANKREFSTYTNQFGLMIDELDRTNLIIKEYLTLSKHRTIDLKLNNLNVIIESLYPLVKADSNADNKDIHMHLSDISLIYLDEKEIRQLILNIVRNGLEATSSDGIVIIRTFQQSDEIVLSIQDNGSGIPQHILDNLGKPFVTTKETGTGLGLATCYRIASRHQAVIKVESTPSGTTFNICFKIP